MLNIFKLLKTLHDMYAVVHTHFKVSMLIRHLDGNPRAYLCSKLSLNLSITYPSVWPAPCLPME